MRPTIKQINMYRWVCRRLKIPSTRIVRMQRKMTREAMSQFIKENHAKAELLGFDLAAMAKAIQQLKESTKAQSKTIGEELKASRSKHEAPKEDQA